MFGFFDYEELSKNDTENLNGYLRHNKQIKDWMAKN